MKEFVLFQGEVWEVMRKDHFNDDRLWHLRNVNDTGRVWNRWVTARSCVPLDPALNVLFERNRNG